MICFFSCSDRDFNPRPPRGGRPLRVQVCMLPHRFQSTSSARRTTTRTRLFCHSQSISIHVLREEDDVTRKSALPAPWRISIHVLREEDDGDPLHRPRQRGISIHVLREEDDRHGTTSGCRPRYFNPRPPRGGRHVCNYMDEMPDCIISIHVLREEDDCALSAVSP